MNKSIVPEDTRILKLKIMKHRIRDTHRDAVEKDLDYATGDEMIMSYRVVPNITRAMILRS